MNAKFFLILLMGITAMSHHIHSDEESSEPCAIVTIDSPEAHLLHQKAAQFTDDEMPLAREIYKKLVNTLKPRMPAAGLAAPQIGISRAIFIFSYDRTLENLVAVVNPHLEPADPEMVVGWEGCFSVIGEGRWLLAQVPRYDKILVRFQTLDGEIVEIILEGFAAKVFQHEYDHLQGFECIDHPKAVVRIFSSEEELDNFFLEIKKEDAKRYRKS